MFVTFVIPSINRLSLIKTLDSILNQTNDNWKVVIIFDGVIDIHPSIETKCNNEKISFHKVPKQKDRSCVRNIGIQMCTTPWIAFVDDDDTISSDYTEMIYQSSIQNNKIDCIIFRMINNKNYILPEIFCKHIKKSKVGISFSCKKEIFHRILFKNNYNEDFNLLKRIYLNKYTILVHESISYFVNCLPFDTSHIKCNSILNPTIIY